MRAYTIGLSPERVAHQSIFSLLGILKRVIVTSAVYPRLFGFLYVDIQSTGRTLSRPWSRQPNDVMYEIECAQLHSELFGRWHSTLQSQGLFALAKALFGFLVTALQVNSVRSSQVVASTALNHVNVADVHDSRADFTIVINRHH